MTADFLVWRDLRCRVLFLRTISNSPSTVLAAICELHYKKSLGSVAQSVEQRPFKALVPGSSPGRPKFHLRLRTRFQSGAAAPHSTTWPSYKDQFALAFWSAAMFRRFRSVALQLRQQIAQRVFRS